MLGPFGRGDVVVLLLSRCVRVRVGEREKLILSPCLYVNEEGGRNWKNEIAGGTLLAPAARFTTESTG